MPAIKGLTDSQFDGVGIRTLEAWAKYWRMPEKYERDDHDQARAAADLKILQAEIDARRAEATELREKLQELDERYGRGEVENESQMQLERTRLSMRIAELEGDS